MNRRRSKRERPDEPVASDGPATARIWDLPTRLSHWAIAVLFMLQFLSGQFGLFPPAFHLWAGYALLAAVLFRLQWGLIGPDRSRFSHFTTGPRAVGRYLAGLWTRQPSHWPGHNPLGGWSSVAMLLLLSIQIITGLLIETWGELRGPLAERVSRDTAIFMADVHALVLWPLLGLIGLHILAACSYLIFKRENRICAIFFSGRLIVRADTADTAAASPARVVLALAVSLGITAAIVCFGPVA